jgi:hypothetical protein
LLKRLGGFDEQFFYYYEDTDLCRRVWEAGYSILYTPQCSITHLGGQSTTNRFTPTSFALDAAVTRYLYYYKLHGLAGARCCRQALLTGLVIRLVVLKTIQFVRPTEARKRKIELFRTLFQWHLRVNLTRLIEKGEEPALSKKPADRLVER